MIAAALEFLRGLVIALFLWASDAMPSTPGVEVPCQPGRKVVWVNTEDHFGITDADHAGDVAEALALLMPVYGARPVQ